MRRTLSMVVHSSRPLTPLSACVAAVVAAIGINPSARAADQYFGGSTTATLLTASVYGTSTAGPFTSAFVSGNTIVFGATGTGTGASISVGGVRAVGDFTLTPGGTISNSVNIVPIAVDAGVTLDLGTQNMSSAAAAGYSYNGNSTGVLALAGNTYQGGFTLTSGVVLARGVNAFGGGAANTLTINGGVLGATASRDLSGKYGGGITVGGNFTFGATTTTSSIASNTANLTFTNNVALGATTRVITIGNAGTYTLGGVISGAAGTGLTFTGTAAGTGTVALNATNTFSGPTTLNLTKVTLGASGTFNNTSGTMLNGTAVTLAASHVATTFNGTTLSNASSITTSTFSAAATTLALGGITRNVGSSLNLTLPTTGTITTTTGNTTGGILGGYAVVGGTNFAVAGGAGGAISALGTYETDYNANTATSNFDATTSGTFGGPSVSSLRFATAAPVTASSPALTVATGGILVTSAVAANAAAITGGTLTSGGPDLIVHQYNPTSAFTIESTVVDGASATALTKAGPGTVHLVGANTYTGGTFIGAGTLQVGNGGTAGSIATTSGVVNNGVLSINRSDNVSLASIVGGAISGIGSVAQNGPGILTLTLSANTFTNGLSVNNGVVSTSSTLFLGPTTTTTTISNGATLRFTNSGSITGAATRTFVMGTGGGQVEISNAQVEVLGLISGAGALTKIGPGTLYLNNLDNSYSGGTNINAGIVRVNSTLALGSTANATNVNAGTLQINTSDSTSTTSRTINFTTPTSTIDIPGAGSFFSGGPIGGTGTLNKTGVSAMFINNTSASNNFSGDFNIIAGQLGFSADASFGSGSKTVFVGAGTLALDNTATTGSTVAATRTISLQSTNSNLQVGSSESWIVNGLVTGTGVLNKTGSGTVTLNATNDYSGGTVAKTGTLTGVTGAFGTGNFAISPSGTTAGGSVTVNSANSIASTAAVTVNNNSAAIGTLNLISAAPTIGSLAGNGRVNLGTASPAAATSLTVGDGSETQFSGVIANATGAPAGSIVKQGTGSLALSGANTYSGGTTVNGGRLLANTPAATGSSTGSGDITVAANGQLAGTGNIAGAVTVSGVISAGSGAAAPTVPGGTTADTAVGTLATGTQMWNPAGTFRVKVASSTVATPAGTADAGMAYDTLSINGGLNLINLVAGDGNTFNIVLLKTATGTFDTTTDATFKIASTTTGFTLPPAAALADLFSLDTSSLGVSNDVNNTYFSVASYGNDLLINFDADPQPAPEPTTAALFAMTTVPLLGVRRRRRKCEA